MKDFPRNFEATENKFYKNWLKILKEMWVVGKKLLYGHFSDDEIKNNEVFLPKFLKKFYENCEGIFSRLWKS